MLTTLEQAKRIIAKHYGPDFEYRILSRAVTYANPPLASGKSHLAWVRLCPGQDSQVRIGLVQRDLTVDWSWVDTPDGIDTHQLAALRERLMLSLGDMMFMHPPAEAKELNSAMRQAKEKIATLCNLLNRMLPKSETSSHDNL